MDLSNTAKPEVKTYKLSGREAMVWFIHSG